jgi:glucosamine 6-phosphate synthetase-like amidotransferase/phosphosugar isomerase protein
MTRIEPKLYDKIKKHMPLHCVDLLATHKNETLQQATKRILHRETGLHPTTITQIIPVQILAYPLATHRGTDQDKPRNLAKSVTVK